MATIRTEQIGVRHSRKSESESYKYYSSRYNSKVWKNLRKEQLQAHPICQICEAHGRVVPAEEIHHVIPWTRGRDEREKENLFYEPKNLLSLCKKCHKLVHKKDNDSGEPLFYLSDEEYENGHGLKFMK